MKFNNILKILSYKFPIDKGDCVFSENEYMAADSAEKHILEIIKSGKIPQSYMDLELKGTDFIEDSSDSDNSEAESSSDDEYTPQAKKQCEPLPYSLNEMQKILALYDDPSFHGNRFKRVTKRYRRITNKMQILRMRDYVEKDGSRVYKLRELDRRLFDQFKQWKNARQIIRDRSLIDAALVFAEELHLDDFAASESWLLSFKKRHFIVGRKVTQLISLKEPRAEANIEEVAKEFVERAKLTIKNKAPKKVFNSDQMGVQLEMTFGRTLAFKGEKQILAAAQNKNSTTHSFTVQPIINGAGELFVPVLVCFYEPRGAPQCFDEDLLPFKNLKCTWTTSGKVTKKLMKDWMKDTFLPVAEKCSVLLVDSWPGFNDAKLIPEVKQKKIEILTIPPKTTGKIQPCDVGFFRYVKTFYRTLEDKTRRLHPDFKLSKRSNIGKLLNQTIEQFRAPQYRSLIAHAFIKSGYFNREYEQYQTPETYCFDFKKIGARCGIENCQKIAFIRCSWCQNYICFNHFLDDLHCCSNDD